MSTGSAKNQPLWQWRVRDDVMPKERLAVEDGFARAYLASFNALLHRLCTGAKATPEQIFELTRLDCRVKRYRYGGLRKASGGRRQISEPLGLLRCLQDILRVDILQHLPVHDAAHGHVPGRNSRTAVRIHAAPEVLVTLDTRNFYDHITVERVQAQLQACGATGETARLITDLCTDQDRLPQGAPTSPALANAVSYDFDAAATQLAKRYNFFYTRFVDDLIFSRRQIGHRVVKRLLDGVRELVEALGLEVHKAAVRRPHQQQKVLGLTLNGSFFGGWARIPRKERRRLRAALHQQAQGTTQGRWDDTRIQGKQGYLAQVVRETAPATSRVGG